MEYTETLSHEVPFLLLTNVIDGHMDLRSELSLALANEKTGEDLALQLPLTELKRTFFTDFAQPNSIDPEYFHVAEVDLVL